MTETTAMHKRRPRQAGHRARAVSRSSRRRHRQAARNLVEPLIVDEADRLKTASLEHLRDHHDRTGVGLILIGMPGIERRLAHYPQLYSRIGSAHEYRPLAATS